MRGGRGGAASTMIDAPTKSSAARDLAISALWHVPSADAPRLPHLYAVLDAARDERIYEGLCRFEHDLMVASLYSGAAAEDLATVCPYLVSVPPDLQFFDWLWREGWGHHWGIFLWCVGTLESVRNHLRRFTRISTEDGKRLIFRFYDPSVLTAVLPILGAGQLKEMFGPFSYYWAEDDAGTALAEFWFLDSALRTRRHSLSLPAKVVPMP